MTSLRTPGHDTETCKLPSLWFRRHGSLWGCWCGRVYRKTTGCAADSCIDEWELIGNLRHDDWSASRAEAELIDVNPGDKFEVDVNAGTFKKLCPKCGLTQDRHAFEEFCP